jgi:hypothetical protein
MSSPMAMRLRQRGHTPRYRALNGALRRESARPWPSGITATVQMDNNPTAGPVKCVYSTQGLETFDRAFTLAGDQPPL